MSSDVSINEGRLQITRLFQAPRSLVFAYWTQAQKLEQWSGCKDASSCQVEMDFRVGGSFVQKMQIKGAEFTISGTYDEIVEPERISYQVDLGLGGVGHVVVEFIEHGSGTKVVLTQDGLPNETICKIVSQGTSESFDTLDQTLALQTV
jgi:uncharacterized protein YndB with AHSA1/START domain